MENEIDVDETLLEIPDNEMMLTTLDNPHNPKKDYNKWRSWDIDHGYNTEALLDRVANIPIDVDDDATISQLTTDAMMFIVQNDVLENYKLV